MTSSTTTANDATSHRNGHRNGHRSGPKSGNSAGISSTTDAELQPASEPLQQLSIWLARGFAGSAVLLAMLVLVFGWWLDHAAFRSIQPYWASMTPNTVLGVSANALAILLCSLKSPQQNSIRYSVIGFASIGLLLSCVTFIEQLLGTSAGIDTLLIPQALVDELEQNNFKTSSIGQMSLATCVGILVISSVLMLQYWLPLLANRLTLIVIGISVLALSGYVFGVRSLYAVSPFSSMAVHTAFVLLLLALATLTVRPQIGFTKVLLSRTAGGTLARIFFLFIPPLQFGLAWLALAGLEAGYYGATFSLTLVALIATMLAVILVRLVAAALYKVDIDRHAIAIALEQAAVTDQLTGLNNRRGFFLLAEKALAAAERRQENRTLFFIDLDGLKQTNDQIGHEAGDELLIRAAEFLRQNFRMSDVIARLGGDEFAILAAEDADAADIIQRLLEQLEHCNRKHQDKVKLAFSIGAVSCPPTEKHSLEILLAQADALMYKHKKSKRPER